MKKQQLIMSRRASCQTQDASSLIRFARFVVFVIRLQDLIRLIECPQCSFGSSFAKSRLFRDVRNEKKEVLC